MLFLNNCIFNLMFIEFPETLKSLYKDFDKILYSRFKQDA